MAARDLPRSAAGEHNPWLIAVIISVATFMEVLDVTIANVALRHIAGSLAASRDESTWILTTYLVSNAVVLPISGWLSNVIGRKRFYMTCVALFTVASVMCSMATTLGFMLVARTLQGAGGGGLAPSEQSMLADSFPQEKRAQVFSLYGLTVVLAPAVGPVLGGWLTDNFSWHWVFLINLPMGLLSLSLVALFVDEPEALRRDRAKLLAGGLKVDYVGFAMVVLGFGCLQIVLDRFLQDDGFSSTFITVLALCSVISLGFLVLWESVHPQPAMDIGLFRVCSFAVACAVMFLMFFVLISSTQLMPQLTQELLGYDATSAGMTLAFGGIATLIGMPVAGLVTGRLVQPRWLIIGAMFVSGFAMLHLSHLDLDVSFYTLSFARAFQTIALPFLFIPITAASYIGVPPNKTNEASAIINLMRNLGGSVGVSFSTTLLAWRTQFHHERLAESVTPFNDLHGMSIQQLGSIVQTQASIMSYLDVFHLLGLLALMVWPIVLFLRNPPKGQLAVAH
jgi:DHA2 family multidrug resistance protein